jgi:hypothetical protein
MSNDFSPAFGPDFDALLDVQPPPPVEPVLSLALALHDALAPLVAGRAHPVILPEHPVWPCIRYTNVGGGPDNTICGRSSLNIWRYRIDVFAETVADIIVLRNAVTNVMDDFRYPCLQVMDMDGYEPEVRVFRRMMDYSIHEQEAALPL